jgi:hypothetical protein
LAYQELLIYPPEDNYTRPRIGAIKEILLSAGPFNGQGSALLNRLLLVGDQ